MSICRVNTACVLGSWTVAAFVAILPAYAGFPSENVSLHSHLTLADLGAEFAEDCWGYVSDSGREYAIIGLSTGTGFVEITDPANPVIVGVVLTPNRGRDMKVYQHYVYTSSDSGPSHVIDVQDIDSGVITLIDSQEGGTHNIFVNEQSGFLYASIGGLMVVLDLANPEVPVLAGVWEGQAHDVQVVTYNEGPYAGLEIAFVFAGWDQAVNIVDVTNKLNMFLVGTVGYPDAGYTHQGWLSADGQYLYVNDELDDIQRTLVFDVSDLANPVLAGEFSSTAPTAVDHNIYLRDGFIYEANYTSGLRVFDTCDPVNPVEVGYFDTIPDHDDPGFDGAWSNYPFFPSGTVIVSDRSGGLFVLDVSEAISGGCSNCPADFDGDEEIGPADLAQLLASWGLCLDCPTDLNGDGEVGPADLAMLLAAWGPCK